MNISCKRGIIQLDFEKGVKDLKDRWNPAYQLHLILQSGEHQKTFR